MKKFKINQFNSLIKYHLEEGENVEDYDIQESNFEEYGNQIKRKIIIKKLASGLNWPKFKFDQSKCDVIKKTSSQSKCKKRRSLSYITNVLPIFETEEKIKKRGKETKNESIESKTELKTKSKIKDEYQIDDNLNENIENEHLMKTLLVKTIKRRFSNDVELCKMSKLNSIYETYKENENEIVETCSSQIKYDNDSFKNNSKWLMLRNKAIEKKLSKSTKGWQKILINCTDDDRSLTFQLKSFIEKDQIKKSAWLHSTTSKLKNKITENISNQEYVCIQLFKVVSTFGLTFADGKIVESNLLNYLKDEVFHISFPQGLSEDMGLSNYSIIKLIWPWKLIEANNQKLIFNPFWIDVISRSNQDECKDENNRKEKIIFSFKCPCRENLNINPLECNKMIL